MTERGTGSPKRITNNLRVIIKSPDEVLDDESDGVRRCFTPFDHVIGVGTEDAVSLVPQFIEGAFCRPAISKDLTITGPANEAIDISAILDAAEQWLDKFSTISLHRCYVSPSLFERLVSKWSEVVFLGCAFAPRWQSAKGTSCACNSLSFTACRFADAGEVEVGCAAWPQLDSLSIDEDHWVRTLTSATEFQPRPISVHSSTFQSCSMQVLRAFLSSTVSHLQICDWKTPLRLNNLPVQMGIDNIDITGTSVLPSDLRWIAEHRNLENLTLSWLADTKLPWSELACLDKLKYLDLTSSPLSDRDLAEILDHTSLRTIHLYYTRTTSASWKRLLSEPSLRSVWVSQEMLGGEPPADLPAETGLKEAVAMNARTEMLRELLKNYPDVEIVQM